MVELSNDERYLSQGKLLIRLRPGSVGPYLALAGFVSALNRFSSCVINPDRMPEPMEQHVELSLSAASA
jgi:hypothetical protein